MSTITILALFAMISTAVVLAGQKFANNGKRRAHAQWLKSWLTTPIAVHRDSPAIEGTWQGTWDYAKPEKLKHAPTPESTTYTAVFSHCDGALAGQITDSLGVATIQGVIDYPSVRFQKTYPKGTRNRPDGWSVYYEGKFSPDQQSLRGGWFVNPLKLESWYGTWEMTRSR